MRIIDDIPLCDFEAWSGGRTTLERIIDEDKGRELEAYIEECYPDGITATQLNDILWFERDFVYNLCGIYDCSDE